MALDTYTNLLAAIADELSRGDLTSKIPDWVTMAQSYIARETDGLLEGEQFTTDNLVASQAYLDMPTGFRRLIHMEIQGQPLRILNQVSLDKRSDVLENSRDGRPVCFAMIGKRAYFAPVPTGTDEIHIFYHGYPPVLATGTNEANELLADAPDALFYSSLMYSAPYLGDDERVMTWKTLRDEAIATLSLQQWQAGAGGGPMAMRPDRLARDTHK